MEIKRIKIMHNGNMVYLLRGGELQQGTAVVLPSTSPHFDGNLVIWEPISLPAVILGRLLAVCGIEKSSGVSNVSA